MFRLNRSKSRKAQSEEADHFSITEIQLRNPPLTIHDLNCLLEETRAAERSEFPEPGRDDPAFILYTSGSTGEPKGAIHCQSDIFYTNETFCREVLRLTTEDRLFSSSRLPFAYGLGNSFSFPLLNGATTILCREKPSPDVIARIFKEQRPTIFFGVPVIYNLLLEHHRSGSKLDCSSLRLCVSAGEALPAHLGEEWEREFGVQLLDGIGSTEMLHMFMSNHENEVRYGSSGRCSRVTRRDCWTNTENPHLTALKETCGSKATAPRVVTGKIPKPRHKLLSMAGFAPEISIAATAMGSGFTWAAVTIVSNRAGNGFHRSKSKARCCGIRESRGRRWLKILTPISFPARVRLL